MQQQIAKFNKILLQPLAISAQDAHLFAYRVSNLLQTLSPYQIKLARLIENKQLILKSSKMKGFFRTHKKERVLVVHKLNQLSKKFHKRKIILPNKVPQYLIPRFLRERARQRGNRSRLRQKMQKRKALESQREAVELGESQSAKGTKQVIFLWIFPGIIYTYILVI